MSLSELLDDLGLDIAPEAIVRLERLVDELVRWNRRRNLTAIIARDEILEKHLVDSLTLLPFISHTGRLLDIGSGAGFPALPLKITRPDLKIVSVDSVGKKIDFQRHIARSFRLNGFTALHDRIEALVDHPDYGMGFDIVTARALCSLEELLVMARPFLAPEGRLLAMKGPDGDKELAGLDDQLLDAGWSVAVHHLRLPVSGAARCLIEMRFS